MKIKVQVACQIFQRFRKRVRDIEIIVDNLVASAFENVRNVEEGIDVLWATYQYAKRPNLKDLFEKKTYHVSSIPS